MQIGTTTLGPGHTPYIIAEIGVNHDGSPARALALTRLAAEAGAHAVKFQLFEADRLMSAASKLAAYQKAAGETDPVAMLRRLELSIDSLRPCVELARTLGVHAIVSVFSVELVPIAERLAWDAYKTASPDIINRPLLEALASTGRPLIVSTGASTLDEVARAAEWLAPARGRLAVLQCVSQYPTPAEHAELGGIVALSRAFPALPIGYSDHTQGMGTGLDAARLGACVLEKHFTDDTSRRGPDHAASLDPTGLREYVRRVREGWNAASAASGLPPGAEGVKRVLPIEEDVRRVSRQSLVTARALPAGHTLTREDLTIKRPGTGVPPFELGATLGRRLSRAVEADMPLMAADLA